MLCLKEVRTIKLKLQEGENKSIYLTDPGFFGDDVIMAFTTRFGGHSLSPYNSLNLSYLSGDEYKNVLKNRISFLEALNIDVFAGVLAGQVHGDRIEVVRKKNSEFGILLPGVNIENTDGLITASKNLPLVGTFADCVPLFFYDNVKKVVAISHAGWRGTKQNIAKKTIDNIIKETGGKAGDIKVIIGPSIGSCCYEVGTELYDVFKDYSFHANICRVKNQRLYLDLWLANRIQLEEAGVLSENILVSKICTHCNNDFFFSYRKEKGNTGRMMGLIMLS